MYCIDASVITNSIIEKEEHHEYSKKLMLKIKNENIPVVLPELVIPEVASALSIGTKNSELSLQFVNELRRIPNFIFIPIDAEISNLAAKLAAEKLGRNHGRCNGPCQRWDGLPRHTSRMDGYI
jgi:predicted nucleic acid-binding protein